MKIHVEFNSVAEMVNFSKFAGNDLVQVPQTEKQKAEETKYKQMYETTLGNLERAYERLRDLHADERIKKIIDQKELKQQTKQHKQRIKEQDRAERAGIGLLNELGSRTMNCLKGEGIHFLPELLSKTADELLAIHNFGKGCLKELREALAKRNLKLKGD